MSGAWHRDVRRTPAMFAVSFPSENWIVSSGSVVPSSARTCVRAYSRMLRLK